MDKTTRFRFCAAAWPTNCSAKSPPLAGPEQRWMAKMVSTGNSDKMEFNLPTPPSKSRTAAARMSATDERADVDRNQGRLVEADRRQGMGSAGRKAADQEELLPDLIPNHELGSSDGFSPDAHQAMNNSSPPAMQTAHN